MSARLAKIKEEAAQRAETVEAAHEEALGENESREARTEAEKEDALRSELKVLEARFTEVEGEARDAESASAEAKGMLSDASLGDEERQAIAAIVEEAQQKVAEFTELQGRKRELEAEIAALKTAPDEAGEMPVPVPDSGVPVETTPVAEGDVELSKEPAEGVQGDKEPAYGFETTLSNMHYMERQLDETEERIRVIESLPKGSAEQYSILAKLQNDEWESGIFRGNSFIRGFGDPWEKQIENNLRYDIDAAERDKTASPEGILAARNELAALSQRRSAVFKKWMDTIWAAKEANESRPSAERAADREDFEKRKAEGKAA
ncbi:MAG TPA: hypothetical protein VGQ65_11560 [Thermoanaerobaculia bacterium]|nr:hypothetical protein [Thermoanaerobaculia bacterium]